MTENIISNEIHKKISESICNYLQRFKKKEISELTLNENLVLNVSSMCKFLQGKEKSNQEFDLVIPLTKLQEGIDSKLKPKENENIQNNIIPSLEENSFLRDINNVVSNNLSLDQDESLLSRSLMLETNNDFFEESLYSNNKTEISTIYNKPSVINESSILDNSFQNFCNRINISELQQKASNEENSSDDKIENTSNLSIKKQVEQIYIEINSELKEKEIKEFILEMNGDYIRSMYSIYLKIKKESEKSKECEKLIFINKFKLLILDIGISDKKFYEKCIREIIYNKNDLKFIIFLTCCHNFFYLKIDQNFLKYKFLLYITKRKNDDYLDIEEMERFYKLLESKKVYDVNLHNKITTKLVEKYRDIFPNEKKFYIKKIAIVLEQFFEFK